MSINTYLSTIESKQQTKQVSRPDRIIDMEIILTIASWEEEGENGGKGADIKKYRLVGTKEAGGC